MKPTGGITGALVENGYLHLPDVTEFNKMSTNYLHSYINNECNKLESNYENDYDDDREIHIHLTININSDINKESAKIISDNINKLIKFK